MRRVIFTIYDDFAKEQDQWGTNNYATEAVAEYFDRLLENKETYAKSIGVDFKFYHNTMTDFAIETDLEFTKSNLYKHGIMADLANEYDEIMYVDMDVVFNTNKNVFDELDLSKGIHIQTETEKVKSKWDKFNGKFKLNRRTLLSVGEKYIRIKDIGKGVEGGDYNQIDRETGQMTHYRILARKNNKTPISMCEKINKEDLMIKKTDKKF